RQPPPAVVHTQGPDREQQVRELPPAVREPARVAPRGAMGEGELHLPHLDPRARRVDRHTSLGAEPGREREDRGPRALVERALARERLPPGGPPPPPGPGPPAPA